MTIYAGLDVSDKATHICVVDDEVAVVRRAVVASDPDVLTKWLDKIQCCYRGVGPFEPSGSGWFR